MVKLSLTEEQSNLLLDDNAWADKPVVFEVRDQDSFVKNKVDELFTHLEINGYRNLIRLASNMFIVDNDEAPYVGTCAEDYGIDRWLTWDASRLIA